MKLSIKKLFNSKFECLNFRLHWFWILLLLNYFMPFLICRYRYVLLCTILRWLCIDCIPNFFSFQKMHQKDFSSLTWKFLQKIFCIVTYCIWSWAQKQNLNLPEPVLILKNQWPLKKDNTYTLRVYVSAFYRV